MIWAISCWVVAVAGLVGWWVVTWPAWRMMCNCRQLSDIAPALPRRADGSAPSVSVMVPSCNEEAAIEKCIKSLLAQDYPAMQVVAINDRSTDSTGEILNRLAKEDPRLIVREVKELPSGWLGKNHANHTGAAATHSDWILFTDGDVIFEPNAIARAVTFAEREGLDHLCLMPGLIRGTFLESASCCLFGVLFSLAFVTWHVRNPLRRDAFCGVGAFNLVRRRAYETIGGHVPLRMEVGDDVKLGKLLKHGGFICDAMAGWPTIRVRWQIGLWGVVKGLEKNGFCGADYVVWKSVRGFFILTSIALVPILGTIFGADGSRFVFAVWFASQVALLSAAAKRNGSSVLSGIAFPIGCLTLAIALIRSMILAKWRGGIIWRGTLYPLDALRRGLV